MCLIIVIIKITIIIIISIVGIVIIIIISIIIIIMFTMIIISWPRCRGCRPRRGLRLPPECEPRGQQIAHQKSTPQKSSWISNGIVQWLFSGVFRLEFHFCDFWCVISCPERRSRSPSERVGSRRELAVLRGPRRSGSVAGDDLEIGKARWAILT